MSKLKIIETSEVCKAESFLVLPNRNWVGILLIVVLIAGACGGEEPPPDNETGDSGTSSNVPSATALSPEDLRDAALNGRLDLVRQAAEQGVDVNDTDPLGRTALMFASFNGHTEIVRFLVEQDTDVNEMNTEGRTPLMFAASGPFPDTVELLLKEGAEPDTADSIEGWTVLMYAAAEGNADVVRILLNYEADISLEDKDGETAIDFARNNGHTEVVHLLEENL